jgi:hypothetical protein
VDETAPPGAPRRRRWLLTVAGAFVVLLGMGGLIGNIASPRASYWVETYGPWGLALSLGFDAVFIALGAYMIARGSPQRPQGAGLLTRADAFAMRVGERSRWRDYSPTKRHVAASLLTLWVAVVSFGMAWLWARADTAGPVPWFFGGAWFVWFTALLWGLTVDPTKATKWALLLGPPFLLVIGIGGGVLWWALTS